MNQIISKYSKRHICHFLGKSPWIPEPACHLSIRVRQKQPVLQALLCRPASFPLMLRYLVCCPYIRCPVTARNLLHIKSDIGRHPFRSDIAFVVLIYRNMLRPFPLILFHPEGLTLTVTPYSPAKQYQFVLSVMIDIAGQCLLDPQIFGGSPYHVSA